MSAAFSPHFALEKNGHPGTLPEWAGPAYVAPMSKLLQTGLILLGIGALSGSGIFLFKWGPCGPSSIWSLIFMLIAMASLAVGSLFVVAGLLKMLAQRVRVNS